MQADRMPVPLAKDAPRRTRLGRQRQVVTVLTRHGFGLLVQHSPVPLPGRSRLRGRPESLRDALEELGTTFIKLGQILSTRSDLLPDEYILALSSLQDNLPPIPLDDMRGMIERELGAPPEELFASFDPVPLATASIGQVHAATAHDGSAVVVKVQKPGIAHEVELDLLILHDLARLAADRLDLPLLGSLEETVEQFSDTLREELDYVHEGRNAERFRRLLGEAAPLVVPRIHWDLTTSRVLTMGRIQGVKITDLQALAARGIDRARVAANMADLVLRQVLDHGFFHADPHPGNYFVADSGTIGIVDFGMVGTLDEPTRRDLLLLLAAWVRSDADGLAEGLMTLGLARGGTEIAQLRADLRRVLNRYHDVALGEVHFGRVMADIFRLARRHHLILRGDLALMAKTLAMHEGLGLILDPQFRLVEAARPYVEGALRKIYLPHLDPQAAALNLGALVELAANLPQRANRLLGRIERGDLGLVVRPGGVEWLMRDLNRMVNRLAVSILTAAFLVGLAIVLQLLESNHGSILLIALFAGGMLASGILGLWLLLSMWRSGRLR
jgi:ubiquinone biosynthesis protein